MIGTLRGRFSVFIWTLMGKPEDLAIPSKVIDEAAPDQTPEAPEPKRAEFTTDFTVTGKSRVPWHIRRKELEAAARTKRKRLESFQEYV